MQAAARAAFMDAPIPGEADSSDEDEGSKRGQPGGMHPAASDASFTSTSTGLGGLGNLGTQRFKVSLMAIQHCFQQQQC